VLNGSEIAGGSIRIHDQALQRSSSSCSTFRDEEAKLRFGFFVDALEYGTPPHGGIALGLDRIVAILAGEPRSAR
jgi:aspartyl-tRNA synthetase